MKAWDDEKTDYTYSTKACSAVCGHYTQVVWANSEYVGCAAHTCSSFTGLSSSFNGGTIVVCNYGPGGNYNKQFPYLTGTPCSACPSGTTCAKNLCDDGSGNTNVVEPQVDSITPQRAVCVERHASSSVGGASPRITSMRATRYSWCRDPPPTTVRSARTAPPRSRSCVTLHLE